MAGTNTRDCTVKGIIKLHIVRSTRVNLPIKQPFLVLVTFSSVSSTACDFFYFFFPIPERSYFSFLILSPPRDVYYPTDSLSAKHLSAWHHAQGIGAPSNPLRPRKKWICPTETDFICSTFVRSVDSCTLRVSTTSNAGRPNAALNERASQYHSRGSSFAKSIPPAE